MKTIVKIINLLVLLFILQSCNSTKLIPQDKRISFDQNNLNLINGRYDNNSDDTTKWQTITLWKHLKPFCYKDTSLNKVVNQKISNSYVKIEIIEMNKIQFNLYDFETIKESKVFNFKIKDGVILIKNKWNKKRDGIPLLFYRQHNETLNLALDKNSNLILSYEGSASGGIFIINVGIPIQGTNVFMKK